MYFEWNRVPNPTSNIMLIILHIHIFHYKRTDCLPSLPTCIHIYRLSLFVLLRNLSTEKMENLHRLLNGECFSLHTQLWGTHALLLIQLSYHCLYYFLNSYTWLKLPNLIRIWVHNNWSPNCHEGRKEEFQNKQKSFLWRRWRAATRRRLWRRVV